MTAPGFLHGPGWTIPDQGLNQHPINYWPELTRAAVEAIEYGLGDRVGYRYFGDALHTRAEAAARALAHFEYVVKLRRRNLTVTTRTVTTRTVELRPSLRGGSVASEAEARIGQGIGEAVQRSIFDELEA